ncbi:MAG: hypothetical protein ABWZ40_12090 [Caulobacterales bacterium]
MLLDADEMLFHQTPQTMAQTNISDHRFYDRHWFTGFDPKRGLGFNLGMGLYKNMNVLDGFLAVMNDNKQYNIRLSRVLRPEISTKVGPLSIEIIAPYKHIRLRVEENEHGIGCNLDWRSDYDVHLEEMQSAISHGMLTQQNTRYDQTASVTGWLLADGVKHPVESMWSVRDHSWGVRPGVGGFEPIRSDHGAAAGELPPNQPRLWLWAALSTANYSLQMQRIEDRQGRIMHLDGQLLPRPGKGGAPLKVKALNPTTLEFFPGTRAVKALRYDVELSDGSRLDVIGEPAIRAWAYAGTGYDKGYNDGRGLGAQRGNLIPEYDVYDLSHPEIVRNAAGAVIGSGHREQAVKLTVNGEACVGHFPVMVFDTLPGMSD